MRPAPYPAAPVGVQIPGGRRCGRGELPPVYVTHGGDCRLRTAGPTSVGGPQLVGRWWRVGRCAGYCWWYPPDLR